MSVHVEEIHSEFLPAPGTTAGGQSASQQQPHLAEEDEKWGMARHRAEQLERRLKADGFDD